MADWQKQAGPQGPSPGCAHQTCFYPMQGNMDQERLKKQQELATAALYQQLQHQQFLQLVGRYRGCEAWPSGWPVVPRGPLLCCLSVQSPTLAMFAPGKGSYGGPGTAAAATTHDVSAAAPGSQTPQVCVGMGVWILRMRPRGGGQTYGYRALKVSSLLLRGGDQNLLPTISRSLSVPDSSPLWDIHTSASSQSGE